LDQNSTNRLNRTGKNKRIPKYICIYLREKYFDTGALRAAPIPPPTGIKPVNIP
jgi:hypothetical protein